MTTAAHFTRLAAAINRRDSDLRAAADTTDSSAPSVRVYLRSTNELVDIVAYDRAHVVYRWGPSHQHFFPVAEFAGGPERVADEVIATAGRDVVSTGQMSEWLARDMLGVPVVDTQVDEIDEVPPDFFLIKLANGQVFKVTVSVDNDEISRGTASRPHVDLTRPTPPELSPPTGFELN